MRPASIPGGSGRSTCGAPIPIAYCIDEYHVIRPFDAEYTEAQMENSQTAIQAIAVLVTYAFAGVATFVIVKLVDGAVILM